MAMLAGMTIMTALVLQAAMLAAGMLMLAALLLAAILMLAALLLAAIRHTGHGRPSLMAMVAADNARLVVTSSGGFNEVASVARA